ncbi:hypothetical protein ACVWZ4_001262 [Bradyrhizobium sp. USDA 4472]
MANIKLYHSITDAHAQRISSAQKMRWRAEAPRLRGVQMIRDMKPMARMVLAARRALAISDLDRCCAIWWLYRIHFGFTGKVILGLAAVTVAQETSRCGI